MITLREVKINEPQAKACVEMIRHYSWGPTYPVDAWDELRHSDYIIGCFNDGILIGFANITRVASPDGFGAGEPWFADVVVLPDYRRKGIFTELYKKCMEYLKNNHTKKVFTCTDNPVMEKFFTDHGWILDRDTYDESGGACKVFQLNFEYEQ